MSGDGFNTHKGCKWGENKKRFQFQLLQLLWASVHCCHLSASGRKLRTVSGRWGVGAGEVADIHKNKSTGWTSGL